jgi:hypothetical protein
MNVIFLDVDGVLNTVGLLYHYGFEYIDEDMVELLSKLVVKTGAKIVLSSTWRLDKKSRRLVDEALARQGMSVLDRTPKIEGAFRSEEISDWLGRHPEVVRYAIIDDTPEAGIGLEKNFFRTDPDIGLDEKIAGEIFRHLGSQKAS